MCQVSAKKRVQEEPLSRVDYSSSSNSAQTLDSKILLDFVIAHAKNDSRPYLNVEIYGLSFLGLLDSGSSRTILGGRGWKRLINTGVLLSSSSSGVCTVANGEQCKVEGVFSAPIRLGDRVRVIELMVVPSLPHDLILGMDFWLKMAIIPDLYSDVWTFKNESNELESEVMAIHGKENLNKKQQQELEALIEKTFSDMGDKLGCTTMVEHVIHTEAEPIKQRHYPLSPALQKQVNEELNKMLNDGIVEPSNSPWASPIILVKKSDGTYRFCVDYRQLNKVTKRDAYPLPFVSATLDKLRDAHYLTTLDIKSAYWQIPLSEKSKPLTAFVVPTRGLYQFTRMPFGLHNAPATWQRFIDRTLGVDLEQYVFCYLDDIVISTSTFEKHLEVLNTVLERLRVAGLTLNREKCKFCVSELKYLGYVVNSSGLMVDPEKVEAIINIPTPKNTSEVRRIIGLASWYRRFVPNFSSLISPMTALLRKNTPFVWNQDCEKSLEEVKNNLISAPILTCPNFELPFVVQTDASDYGIGCVLSQEQDGQEKVIAYLSRSLTKVERKYSVTEKECLSVLYAIEKLRPYLEGSRFTVITDHYSLKWLHSIKDPTGRIARWSMRLQQYDFDVVHRKGKDHIVPDALSRAVPEIAVVDQENIQYNLFPEGEESLDGWYISLCDRVRKSPSKYPGWWLEGKQLYKKIKTKYPTLIDAESQWAMVVPKERRQEIIRQHHDPPTCGHLGVYKTVNRLSMRYYWPKMRYDVAKYIKSCTICLKTKPEQKPPAGMMRSQIPTVSKPWQLVSADIVGPLPRSTNRNCYILSVCDCFSKFVLLFPMRTATAATVTRLIEDHVFLIFGAPNKIITDNGVQFRSHLFTNKMREYDVKICYTANYHPQSNPVERIHRVVKTMLTSYVADNQRQWDKYLAKVAWAIRSARHEVTGQTPNLINFGREVVISGKLQRSAGDTIEINRDLGDIQNRIESLKEIFKDVSKRLKVAYERSARSYNLRRRDEGFNLNQEVWRRNHFISDASKSFSAKLAPKFSGPFKIKKIVSAFTYQLEDHKGKDAGIWHSKDLKAHPPENENSS